MSNWDENGKYQHFHMRMIRKVTYLLGETGEVVFKRLISKEISRAEHEYMDIHIPPLPPPPN